jgi:hypothetical protein
MKNKSKNVVSKKPSLPKVKARQYNLDLAKKYEVYLQLTESQVFDLKYAIDAYIANQSVDLAGFNGVKELKDLFYAALKETYGDYFLTR